MSITPCTAKPAQFPSPTLAAYFGYPACCEAYFHSVIIPTDGGDHSLDQDYGFHGTGFRPCPACLKRPIGEVYAQIVANRTCPHPFPVDDQDARSGLGRASRKITRRMIRKLRASGTEPSAELKQYLLSIGGRRAVRSKRGRRIAHMTVIHAGGRFNMTAHFGPMDNITAEFLGMIQAIHRNGGCTDNGSKISYIAVHVGPPSARTLDNRIGHYHFE